MGLPQSPSPPHLYPQALQLKLYQAFIFSIPILFSIILFLLFYLFYLKRRASSLSSSSSSSSPPILPTSSNNTLTLYVTTACQVDLKADNLIDKLPKIQFNEELKIRDSLCCVCLGEFEIKEELLQVPSCKHVFHIDCMNHWLISNSTCPLCRCSVIPTTQCSDPAVVPPTPPLPLPGSSELPLTSDHTAEIRSYSL
ncbi:probable E3 ubiquitin-protein ligase RHA4A [Cucumis sativus]|uniref:RING-type E3 ubiquitin transferase n=1 Tax=Cucumis sativus TaxID=3659 RepID=A0A0A0KME5_CUCSA|nr:probable E3 ubiquitin-protein ligase RHA4A [Cucumis sativus]KGN50009.1 hypothetical protein Csa_000277 [Cucumis sativus]